MEGYAMIVLGVMLAAWLALRIAPEDEYRERSTAFGLRVLLCDGDAEHSTPPHTRVLSLNLGRDARLSHWATEVCEGLGASYFAFTDDSRGMVVTWRDGSWALLEVPEGDPPARPWAELL